MLYLERKRAERSGRSFILMLLESVNLLRTECDRAAFHNVVKALSRSTRDTDILGWYKDGSIIGVIFTEVPANKDGKAVANALLSKVTAALSSTLSIKQIHQISLSFHVFPEDWDNEGPSDDIATELYDNLLHHTAPNRASLTIKRAIDIVGSSIALALSLPLVLGIGIAIKLTSRGPVLFRQTRLGQYGQKFTFLKFRSMYVNNDHTIHKEYVKHFIAGSDGPAESAGDPTCYKLTVDPRITPLGRILRKTSLDEIPQFWNVLTGDMSLVGPRPPLPYEAACYNTWHRARLLGTKPGITGLWQVHGRSRVKFAEMVRLDIQYAQSWSLWLDAKILLQTPKAVLTLYGAF